MVHFNRSLTPAELQIITLNLPDREIASFDAKKFTKIIDSNEANSKCNEEGKKWLDAKSSLALRIPSVLIPGEHNIIINPEHESFKEIKIDNIENFFFDERFFI